MNAESRLEEGTGRALVLGIVETVGDALGSRRIVGL